MTKSYKYQHLFLLFWVRESLLYLYNEKGQRKNIYYGNNTKTRYYYNVLNFRLERILTTRNNGQDILQDLNYDFDAVGNIISVRDDAQETHFFGNQQIEPISTYEYDALYRLINAKGRELTALTAPNENDFANDIYCPNPAANAMQKYNHNYSYDVLGNILSDKWKTYQYAIDNNYLLGNDDIANQFTYDEHGNMLTMPHLSSMIWNEKDELIGASNGTFTSYYNYDSQGNRTRKVVVKNNIREERYYINGYEVFRKYVCDSLKFERKTINISDDEKVFVRIERKDNEPEVVRYQYDNHLGSACLELDEIGAIISYEEYHAFGSTSYKSGRNETEVSQKIYRYNGKERDEETGLYAYGMRYYAAWLCRFVSCDPLQFEYPHYTPYQYAGNKPITYIDLDGGEEDNPNMLQNLQETFRPVIDGLGKFGNAVKQLTNEVKQAITEPFKNGVKLAIILETKPEKNEFEQHIKPLEEAGFTVVYAKTGADVISLMESNSSLFRPIERLTILSHSGPNALYGENSNDNGLYTNEAITEMAKDALIISMGYYSDNFPEIDMETQINYLREKGARTTEDISKSVASGKIVFAENAKILLGGCSTTISNGEIMLSIVAKMFEATKKPVIGSKKASSPLKTDNKIRVSDDRWYEFNGTKLIQKNKNQDVTNY